MRKMAYALLWLCCLVLVCPAWADQTIAGDLAGSFTGSATDGSGNYSGSISGSWNATGTFSGTTPVATVTANGSFGGEGIAGTWKTTQFDPSNLSLTASWAAAGNRGPSGGDADGAVSLVINVNTGTATGNFQGQIFTAAGTKTVVGTWTVRFMPAASTTIHGKVVATFSGNASFVGAVSGSATGDWTARVLADGSVSGEASGRFDGGNVAVPMVGQVCICGTWQANIVVNAQGQYSLAGAWTHPVVAGSVDGKGGGAMTFQLNLTTLPLQATGSFSGSTGFTVSAPFVGTTTIPVAASGNWAATLPLD